MNKSEKDILEGALKPLPPYHEGIASDVVCAANDSRFEATHFSEPLTAFVNGIKPKEDIMATLRRVVPNIRVARRFEFKKMGKNDHFVTDTDDSDVRAIGAAFKRVDYAGESANGKTLNKGLTVRVDHDDEMLVDGWQESYVQKLLNRLLRRELQRSIAILNENNTNQNLIWNPSATNKANPLKGLRAAMEAYADAVGIYPNKVAFGSTALQYFYDLIEAHENNRIANIRTLQQLAAMLSDTSAQPVDVFSVNVRTVASRKATSKTKVLGSPIFLYHEEDNATKDDGSNMKRFVSATKSGGDYGVYVEERAKYTDITVEHYSTIANVHTEGIRKLTITDS